MSEMRFVSVTELSAAVVDEYRAAFPADRQRVTLDPKRIPGIDHLEEFADTAAWLTFCKAMAGKVSWYALTRNGRILGMLCLRHRLEFDDDEGDFASHIGYSVRPDERGRGHAGEMLRQILPRAREAGVERLRIICMTDNIASRRTVEGAGGVLMDCITGEESGLTVCRYDIMLK